MKNIYIPDMPLDSLRLWKLGREKSDLCESSSGNSEPNSQPSENIVYKTKLMILGQRYNSTYSTYFFMNQFINAYM